MFATNNCPGGALSMYANPGSHPPGSVAGYKFTAPPQTTISTATLWVDLAMHRDPSFAWLYDFSVWLVRPGDSAPVGLMHCFDCTRLDERSFSETTVLNATELTARLECQTRTAPDCPSSAWVSIERTRLSLEDREPPTFTSIPTGSLVDTSAPQSGTRQVTFAASDKGGGLRTVRLEVDGQKVLEQPIDPNDGACREPFTRPMPCKPTAVSTLTFDTTTLEDGRHEVTLKVLDATNQNAVSHGPVTIETINGNGPAAQLACVSTDQRRITARLARRRVPYGRSVLVRGRVRGPDGSPVRGAEVGILRAGSPVELVAKATTRKTGRFVTRARASTNSTLYAGVRLRPNYGAHACGRGLRLRVAARATLRARPRRVHNGGHIRLSGRVLTSVLPPAGKTLVIQARAIRHGRWVTADTIRASRTGRFRWRYRFRRTYRRTTYEFRVRVPRERGFPYVAGRSRRVRVRVVP